MEKNRNFTLKLFASIVIMIVPLFLSFHLIRGLSYSILTMCCFVVSIVLCNSFYDKKLQIRINKDFLFVFIVFITFQFLAIVNGYITDGVLILNDFFNAIGKIIMVFTFIILPSRQSISEEDFSTFARFFTFLSFFICLYNIIDNRSIIANFLNITNSYQFNVTGVFANRNQLGSFMFISIIAHVYYNVNSKITKFDLVVYVLQFVNLVLSMSRGAMLATGIFIIVYLGIYNHLIVKHPLLSICSLVFFLITLTNERAWKFIQNNLIRSEVGNSGRSDVWLKGLEIANTNISTFLIGQGYFHGVSVAQSRGMPFDQFHSFYVDTLISGGLIELCCLIIMFIYVARKALGCCNIKLKQVFCSSFIGYLVLCFFESDSVLSIGYVDMINTIFFVAIPILLGGIKKSAEIDENGFIKRVGESF